MEQFFVGANKQELQPVFKDKRMVFMGPQGVGKTDLFNRLTGSKEATGSQLATLTKKLSMKSLKGQAEDLLGLDTPGTADAKGERFPGCHGHFVGHLVASGKPR